MRETHSTACAPCWQLIGHPYGSDILIKLLILDNHPPYSPRDIRPISRQNPLVNVLAPPKARLSVEIVYDLICPWCYLGVRRLLRTFRRRPDLLFDLSWRPFLLNPDMPRAGMARPDYVIRKFGGEDRAKRLYASITELGRREGVAFAFERIRRTPSSIDAHRLVRFAARYGRADAMVVRHRSAAAMELRTTA